MGTSTCTLAALEVTVRGGGATFLGGEDIRVHAEAHGATCFAELEAGIEEDLVEAFGFGLISDEAGPGDDHGALDVCGDLAALDDLGGNAKIFDAGVGAGADENFINFDILHLGARGEAHVLEHAATLALLYLRGEGLRVRDGAGDRHDVFGAGSPGDRGCDIRAINLHIDIELGALIRLEARPVLDSLVPLICSRFRRKRTALKVLEGNLIRGNHTRTRTGLNRHITHRHTRLHAQPADNRTAELDDSASSTSGTNLANSVEDDVLGAHTRGELAVDLYPHVLGALCDDGLGGEDVLDLRRADAKGEGAKGAMCGGVGVAADDGRTGKGEALLGADDVDDALALVGEAKVCDAELLDVLLERHALESRVLLLDEGLDILEVFAGGGWDILFRTNVSISGPREADDDGMSRKEYVERLNVRDR